MLTLLSLRRRSLIVVIAPSLLLYLSIKLNYGFHLQILTADKNCSSLPSQTLLRHFTFLHPSQTSLNYKFCMVATCFYYFLNYYLIIPVFIMDVIQPYLKEVIHTITKLQGTIAGD